MRRLLVAVAALACVALALPAAAQVAQGAVSARVATPGNGATVSGTVSVRGEGSATAGLRRIAVFINGTQVAARDFNGVSSSGNVQYTWDTTHQIGSSALSANGSYEIRVDVRGNGGENSKSATVHVDNAPTPVSNVQASSQGDRATVTWSANPEPDVVAYRVLRNSQVVGEVAGTSFSEELPAGTHEYRIVAVRSGGRAGEPSAPATTSVAPPPPSTSSSGGSGPETVGGKGSAVVRGNTERGFVTRGGERLGISGLPRGIAVPSFGGGLPSLPRTMSEPFKWGTYDDELPYSFPERAGGDETMAVGDNIAARSPWRIIPPDGLRWLAAGMLLVGAAALMQFVSRVIVAPAEASSGEGAELTERQLKLVA